MPSRKSEVLETPQTTIGAQDLMCIGSCSKTGFLRKQGLLERMFRFLRWRQTFVILSRGCIYVFSDELATRPKESYSLKRFLRTCRSADEGHVRWRFDLLPVNERTEKALLFACINDHERKEWMKSLKAEMIKAHKVTENTTENKDEYVYLEKPLDIPNTSHDPKPSAVTPSTLQCTDEDPDDPGGEKEYDTIEDAMLDEEPPQPRLGVSAAGKKPKKQASTLPVPQQAQPPPTKKKASTLPAPTAIVRSAFEYKGTDRDEIVDMLIPRPEGTYLVRKSRQDGKEVLSVNIEGMLKEFKIYTKDSKVTIDNTDYYDSVEELIQYYTDHPLPKKTTKLYRAYTVVDPRYVN